MDYKEMERLATGVDTDNTDDEPRTDRMQRLMNFGEKCLAAGLAEGEAKRKLLESELSLHKEALSSIEADKNRQIEFEQTKAGDFLGRMLDAQEYAKEAKAKLAALTAELVRVSKCMNEACKEVSEVKAELAAAKDTIDLNHRDYQEMYENRKTDLAQVQAKLAALTAENRELREECRTTPTDEQAKALSPEPEEK